MPSIDLRVAKENLFVLALSTEKMLGCKMIKITLVNNTYKQTSIAHFYLFRSFDGLFNIPLNLRFVLEAPCQRADTWGQKA